mgnify:CR=1 FL=1
MTRTRNQERNQMKEEKNETPNINLDDIPSGGREYTRDMMEDEEEEEETFYQEDDNGSDVSFSYIDPDGEFLEEEGSVGGDSPVVEDKIITKTYIEKIAWDVWSISKIYLFWIVVHFVSANLYAYYCAHLSFYGFLTSAFMTATPHCIGLNWMTNWTHNTIRNMWLTLGTWLVTKIMENKEKKE